jgi:hypothetical protein
MGARLTVAKAEAELPIIVPLVAQSQKKSVRTVWERPFDPNGTRHTIGRGVPRIRPSHAQGATLFVLLQPLPFSTRFPPALFTFEGQLTNSPMPGKGLVSVTVLPITVLPWPTCIPVDRFPNA